MTFVPQYGRKLGPSVPFTVEDLQLRLFKLSICIGIGPLPPNTEENLGPSVHFHIIYLYWDWTFATTNTEENLDPLSIFS